MIIFLSPLQEGQNVRRGAFRGSGPRLASRPAPPRFTVLLRGNPVPVLPGFNLALGFNEGASFGLLGGVTAGKPILLAVLTGGLALIFAVMAFRARHPLERVGLALIVGCALGNIADRLRQGAVTDFLDLYWRNWHWPAFNIADIGITLGALCILLAALQ